MKNKIFNLDAFNQCAKITPYEKLMLIFCKKRYQIDKIEGLTIVYKTFKSKMYIIEILTNEQ